MTGPQARLLGDGRRLHLQHGPIDLVIEVFAAPGEVRRAYGQARDRFATVLEELVWELPRLRQEVPAAGWTPAGRVAARMVDAVRPHRQGFVTPMAAVAGAVADEIMEAMTAGRRISRAYVNNSGDIAVHLEPGESLRLGIVDNVERPAIEGAAEIQADFGIGGVATSGWRGRSHSLGIADAVTVLADNAAAADVAATLVANAVNVDHPAISRIPASSLDPDTDLGDRLVTAAVGELDPAAVGRALEAGRTQAADMVARGLVVGAVLKLGGEVRVAGAAPPKLLSGGGANGP